LALGLRDIDLNARMPKVTEDSERSVPPSVTFRTAMRALEAKGIVPAFSVREYGGFFWLADCNPGFRAYLPDFDHDLRISGKGPTRDQCLASAVMELVERYSLHSTNVYEKKEFECLDLRRGNILTLGPILEMRNTKCVASGNNYEEAILHCLHELLETRIPRKSLWKPLEFVPAGSLFPDLPGWAENSILLFLTPVDSPGFYHFTAVIYPFDGAIDEGGGYKLVPNGARLDFTPASRGSLKPRSPNSGGAAGLNPKKTAFRAMNEIFQFNRVPEGFRGVKRRPLPESLMVADPSALPNLETESITEDIRRIFDILGPDAFIGAVDFTDPELGLPVVKLICDYAPNRSLVSREALQAFFEL
jgi:hypothetical protein